jgi:hypothetical protein
VLSLKFQFRLFECIGDMRKGSPHDYTTNIRCSQQPTQQPRTGEGDRTLGASEHASPPDGQARYKGISSPPVVVPTDPPAHDYQMWWLLPVVQQPAGKVLWAFCGDESANSWGTSSPLIDSRWDLAQGGRGRLRGMASDTNDSGKGMAIAISSAEEIR